MQPPAMAAMLWGPNPEGDPEGAFTGPTIEAASALAEECKRFVPIVDVFGSSRSDRLRFDQGCRQRLHCRGELSIDSGRTTWS